MLKNLRELVKDFLLETDVPLTTIAKKSGVPYGIVYRIKNADADTKSIHLESLYTYFTNKPLIKDEQQG